MTARVLVAYGSKYGATAGIAEAIGETLRERGLATDVRSAADVERIDDYDAVVVGGGVYVGRWHGDAVGFLRRFEHQLAGRPTWLFSSGPTGGTPKAELELRDVLARQPGPPGNVAKLAGRIRPRGHRTFGGRAGSDMGGIFARWIPKGDWRDFDAIRAWAVAIAEDQAVPAI
jgi:menaquinone-dependent protoporphyrinogen oxidase